MELEGSQLIEGGNKQAIIELFYGLLSMFFKDFVQFDIVISIGMAHASAHQSIFTVDIR